MVINWCHVLAAKRSGIICDAEKGQATQIHSVNVHGVTRPATQADTGVPAKQGFPITMGPWHNSQRW